MNSRRKWKAGLFSGDLSVLFLLCLIFFLGSIGGCIFAGFMDTSSESVLYQYVQGYISVLMQPDISLQLWPLVRDLFQFPMLTVALGFTAIGIIGIPALFAIKGFVFCFSVSVFFRLFGFDGYLLTFLLFGFSALIWFPVLFHLGVRGMLASYCFVRRMSGVACYPSLHYRHFICFGLCIAALSICVVLEYFVIPALLQVFAGIF